MPDYHAYLEPGYYYHIYNRGNNGENIFKNQDNYEYFLKQLTHYICPHLDIYAYCLIPNHFHFLAQVKPLREFEPLPQKHATVNDFLGERFQRFLSSYAQAFNRQQNRTGSLFEKRFKRLLVNSDEYCIKLIHYIHNNPIHHHFVLDYHLWKFSSYNAMISIKPSLLKREIVLEWFGGKEKFIDFHRSNIDYGDIKDYLIDYD